MKIEKEIIENTLEDAVGVKCDNKDLAALVGKSLAFLKDALSEDLTPKAKLDKGDGSKIANYHSLKTAEEKLTLLFTAAMEGCANAQHLIANFLYYDGRAFPSPKGAIRFRQNRRLSAMWEFLAAMNGHPDAQYNFAYCSAFSLGKYDGVRTDIPDGLAIMELAANQGSTRAQHLLASVYLKSKDDPFWKDYMDVEKGIGYALKLRKGGIHDFDDLVEDFQKTRRTENQSPKSFVGFLSDFGRYWESIGHSKKGVSSYLSSIRGAVRFFSSSRLVGEAGIAGILKNGELLRDSSTTFNATTQNIKKLMSLLVCGPKNSSLSEKTKSNYASAIAAYFGFLLSRQHQFQNSPSLSKTIDQVLKTANLDTVVLRYDHKKISSNFSTRLNTQDRVYQHVCLPICLINQIVGLDKNLMKKYRIIKREKRESTRFLITKDGGVSLPLSSVVSLSISPNKACEILTENGDKHQVFTEARPFNGKEYEKLLAVNICDLSIDHRTSLKTLLEEGRVDYPAFVELGRKIADFFHYQGNDLRAIRRKITNINATMAKEIISAENIDVGFSSALYDDLERLYSRMEYVIMFGPYNSIKSDSE